MTSTDQPVEQQTSNSSPPETDSTPRPSTAAAVEFTPPSGTTQDRASAETESAAGAGDKAGSAEEALELASGLYDRSQAKSSSGNHAGAYEDAVGAWEQARQFPDHPECSELTDRIFAQLDTLAERANRSVGRAASPDTPLLLE